MGRKKKKSSALNLDSNSDSDLGEYRYIRFSVTPGITEPLFLKKRFEDALMQCFGLSRAGMYIEILRIAESGEEVVVRVAEEDAQALLGAVVAMIKIQISLVHESNILSEVLDESVSVSATQ